jgi:hypothetical protein
MLKRTVLPLLSLAALALPVGAGANQTDIKGPVALRGRGFVRAELQSTQTTKPLVLRVHAGFMRIVDLGGDLKARCGGAARSASKQNSQGQTVFLCVAREGRLGIIGSHYRLFGFAMQYGALVPDGVSGTISGHFRTCEVSGQTKPACGKPSPDEQADTPTDAADDLAALDAELGE